MIADRFLYRATLCFWADSLHSCCTWFWRSDCSLLQCVIEYPEVAYLQHCLYLVVAWQVPCEAAAVLVCEMCVCMCACMCMCVCARARLIGRCVCAGGTCDYDISPVPVYCQCQCMEGGGRGGWVAGVGQRGGSQEDGDVVLAFQPRTFGYSIKPRHLHCK